MEKTKFISFFAICIIVCATMAHGQRPLRKKSFAQKKMMIENNRVPRKLSIQFIEQKTNPQTGNQLDFVISIQDNNNSEIPAYRDVTIEISYTTDEKEFDRQEIIIPKGSSRRTINYTPNKDGILHVKVINDELLEGSTFVKVLPQKTSLNKVIKTNSIFHFASFSPQGQYPFIMVTTDTTRKYLADGIDRAEISISLEDPNHVIADDSLLVLINPGGGQVVGQDRVYINRTDFTRVSLVSKRKGIVMPHITVHKIMNIPIESNDPRIRFVPAIDFFTISAGPSDIHLLNRSKIEVILFDRNKIPIETDENMYINLYVSQGDGSLLPDTTLLIKKGSTGTTGIFMPNSTGEVLIMGYIPSLSMQVLKKPILVSWPILIILTILSGALLGGLAHLLYKKIKGIKNWLTRLIAGIISGVVLYLLYVTGIYKNVFLHSNIHLAVVCLLAIAGGYMGEDVMTTLSNKIKRQFQGQA